MSDYDAILEPLDKKLGRAVTLKDWAAVGQKHVADLTDDDLTIIEAFAGRPERLAKESQRASGGAVPQKSAEPPVVTTKAAAPAVTHAELTKQLHDYSVNVIAPVLKNALAERDARIAALEAAPAALDYKGIWQRAADYRRNQGVTYKGQIYVCLADSRGVEPGTSPACWQLAEKGEAR